MLEIYYTPTSAIIADALAKTYEVVSLETARNIAKKFKASLKQKTDLYVIEGILIDAGGGLVDHKEFFTPLNYEIFRFICRHWRFPFRDGISRS